MQRYQAVHSMLESWKGRKAERAAEYDTIQVLQSVQLHASCYQQAAGRYLGMHSCSHVLGLQSEILSLKARFGQNIAPSKRLGAKANDMSRAGLQILTLELDNLHAERVQRERKLDMLLGRLRKACIELDEDDSAAAAAAHPSLQNHR